MPDSTLRRLAAAGSAAAAVLALAACGSTDNGSSSSSSSAAGGGSAPTVTAVNYAFSPSSVPVSAGTVTVTFKNATASTTHSLVLDNGGGEVVADGGQTQTLTFTAPQSGTVAFHCKFHASMHGSFTVGGGGAGAGGAGSSSSTSSASGYGY